MSGIRVDTEWLAAYAREVRLAGEEISAAQQPLLAAQLTPEAFGEVGRQVGAAESYQRLCTLLLDQHRRAGETLTSAGDELRQVVEFHAGGDDDSASQLARKQEG
ncbi:hypothetical protein GCM10011581_15250 [Saccharopolyspora subtropica]|uniref:Uncharacterized protein n=1 Tax=Saccharopolyspora thermophila TaxID=89367 RepID=A0A917JQQ1_9PSEU|nr:PE domain-containing protein [Saccharopolyspora subtropica]GGI79048.1 hypothetical protein GCM10011581_15250 [Saccharopolyspora subtropica]